MVSNKILSAVLTCLLMIGASANASAQEVTLNSDGRDTAYVRVILGRVAKNISAVEFKDSATYLAVRNIVANRYFELNDIYAERDSLKKNPETKATANAVCDSKLYRSHFALTAKLSLYLNDEQIAQVKDGITMGVVKVTYDATIDMIPTLKEEEKVQIMAWLVEARELALDAESSKKKHEVFGKYKGRINNYLVKRGYDLKAEREAWYKRMDAQGKKY